MQRTLLIAACYQHASSVMASQHTVLLAACGFFFGTCACMAPTEQ